jgi:hypothetical protein
MQLGGEGAWLVRRPFAATGNAFPGARFTMRRVSTAVVGLTSNQAPTRCASHRGGDGHVQVLFLSEGMGTFGAGSIQTSMVLIESVPQPFP